MFSVSLSTRGGDGHVIVELRGELDVVDLFPVHASVDEATGHARRRAAALRRAFRPRGPDMISARFCV